MTKRYDRSLWKHEWHGEGVNCSLFLPTEELKGIGAIRRQVQTRNVYAVNQQYLLQNSINSSGLFMFKVRTDKFIDKKSMTDYERHEKCLSLRKTLGYKLWEIGQFWQKTLWYIRSVFILASSNLLVVTWKQGTGLDRPFRCLICHYCIFILPVMSLLVVAAVWSIVEVYCFHDHMVISIHHLNNWNIIYKRTCISKYSHMPTSIMP